MWKENQMSTILLLALIGFVIYTLSKPSAIKNKGTISEEEESENLQSEEVEERQSEEAQEAQENLGETEMEMIPDELSPGSEEEVESSEEMVGRKLNNFRGNEDTGNGANLNVAFDKPVSNKANTNVVDFKKNIVKKYDSKDYLPQEVNSEWFETDFQQAKSAGSDKMINTERYVVGVNTVGQSLKNPSYDIRGTIPNPKYTVSPWNNSTYEADYNLKPLC